MRELLSTLPASEAARVLGSRERMAQVMNGGDWRKLPGLRLEAVGENARMRKHKDAISNHPAWKAGRLFAQPGARRWWS